MPALRRCRRSARLVWRRFVSSENALYNGDNGNVPFRRLGNARRLHVRGNNIAEQISNILFIQDVCIFQGKKQGFADAEGSQAVDVK